MLLCRVNHATFAHITRIRVRTDITYTHPHTDLFLVLTGRVTVRDRYSPPYPPLLTPHVGARLRLPSSIHVITLTGTLLSSTYTQSSIPQILAAFFWRYKCGPTTSTSPVTAYAQLLSADLSAHENTNTRTRTRTYANANENTDTDVLPIPASIHKHVALLLRVLLVVIAACLAVSIPNFASLMALVGGVTCVSVAYILPPLLYMLVTSTRGPGAAADTSADINWNLAALVSSRYATGTRMSVICAAL